MTTIAPPPLIRSIAARRTRRPSPGASHQSVRPALGVRCRSAFLTGVLASALLAAIASSVGASDYDLLLVVPETALPLDAIDAGRIGEIPRGGAALGTIDLLELSPLTTGDFATGELRVAVYSAYGFIPRYRIRARLEAYDLALPGAIGLDDMGMGVVDIVSAQRTVGVEWDYDPSTVGKDVDGLPLFRGTIGQLDSGLGGRELFRTRQNYFGSWNYFTVVVAVGPQFFSPDPLVPVSLELTLQTY